MSRYRILAIISIVILALDQATKLYVDANFRLLESVTVIGEVIDFLDVYWQRYHWPAFNVADSAITVGVTLLLIDMWREDRKKSPEASARSEEG